MGASGKEAPSIVQPMYSIRYRVMAFGMRVEIGKPPDRLANGDKLARSRTPVGQRLPWRRKSVHSTVAPGILVALAEHDRSASLINRWYSQVMFDLILSLALSVDSGLE